jgi:hypothetical protein
MVGVVFMGNTANYKITNREVVMFDEDSYVEVTHEGFLGQIGGSFIGAFIGIILFVIGVPVLWFNEGRSVNRAKTIHFANDHIVIAKADVLNPKNEKKLIYVTGVATTKEVMKDPTFGVAVKGIKLSRYVEMYQWSEDISTRTHKTIGGSKTTVKTYKYRKIWSDELIDSSDFKKKSYTNSKGKIRKHKNPKRMRYENKEWVAGNVTVGMFKLSRNLIEDIQKSEAVELHKTPPSFSKPIQLIDEYFYIGKHIEHPRIGDMKIRFSKVVAHPVSILAQQSKNELCGYSTPYGMYEQLLEGHVSAKYMIATAKSSNNLLTWGLRALGFGLMFIGIILLFNPIVMIANIIPFLGDLAEIGTAVVAFFISLPSALLVIGIAWFYYRPIIGIPLIAAALFLLIILFIKSRSKN